MARITRVVAPGYPHHITQRGNRQQQTFFSDEAYLLACARYIELNPVRAKLVTPPKHGRGAARRHTSGKKTISW